MTYLYVVRPGENTELRYSLRTLAANLPVDEVLIVGHTPDWVTGVRSIETTQQGTKHENAWMNLLTGLHAIKSGPLVVMNDDFYTLRKMDTVPPTAGGTLDEVWQVYREVHSKYARSINEAFTLLGPGALFYDLHTPFPADVELMLDTVETIRASVMLPERALWRTFYGNAHHVSPLIIEDRKAYDPHWLPDDEAMFASTSDGSWHGNFGAWMQATYDEPCRYEQT